MNIRQEQRARQQLEAAGWQRHSGIGGSYWTHHSMGDKCFSGSIADLLAWLGERNQ